MKVNALSENQAGCAFFEKIKVNCKHDIKRDDIICDLNNDDYLRLLYKTMQVIRKGGC